MIPVFHPRVQRVQGTTDSDAVYALDVKVTWLAPDLIRLSFARVSDLQEYAPQDYFLTPEELARVADHINDVLCR